jgi:2-polyprenyl-3-methyl-5-hydroxy-6-metoxy-1,4-benzoquinol methylase
MHQPSDYYENVNIDLLEMCPNAARVIEFGCGAGWTMGAYKDRNPDAYSVGVEQFEAEAEKARKHFDRVITFDAEAIDLAEHSYQEEYFDLMIYGDVLEHFVDPWSTLKEHLKYLRTGGTLCACIPNTSHWSVIFGLLSGKFDYQDAGLLDRTHLRFFTLASIKSLMEQAGLEIQEVRSRILTNPKTDNVLLQLGRIFGDGTAGITNVQRRDWTTFQYLVSAIKQ